MKRNVLIICGLLAVAAIIFWFASQQEQPIHDNKLKIGYIPIADCTQLYVGIERGFFKEEGLEVEAIKFAGGPKILEALAGGSVDIGFSNLASLVMARNGGLDFVALTGGPVEDTSHVENGILVLDKSDINKPSDLAGKKIAVNTRKNLIELLVLEFLEKNKVDINTVQIVEVPFPNMQSVLLLKQVDAIAPIEPFKTFAEQNDTLRLLANYVVDLYPKVEISSYHTSEKWIKANALKIEKFKKAMMKSTKYCLENPNEIKDILVKYTSLTREQLNKVVLPTFGYNVTESELQSLIDRMYKRGWIKSTLPAKSLIYQ